MKFDYGCEDCEKHFPYKYEQCRSLNETGYGELLLCPYKFMKKERAKLWLKKVNGYLRNDKKC